jgi:hypothetical protein
MSGVLPFMQDEEGRDVIFTPWLNCTLSSQSQGARLVEIMYNVCGVNKNFWTKDSDAPSLTALTPEAFFKKEPVHNCSVALCRKIISHTSVGGNTRLQLCVLTRDGNDQPS